VRCPLKLTTPRAVGGLPRWLAKDLTSLHAAYYILHWRFVPEREAATSICFPLTTLALTPTGVRHRHRQTIMTFRLPVKHRFRQTDNRLWKKFGFHITINKLRLPPTLLMTPRTPPPVHCRGCGHKFSKNKHSFYLPDLHSAPLLGWSHRNFIKIFCVVKLQSPWVIVQHCFWDPMFSCFDTIPACNGQTDRQTCGNSIYCTVIVSCR